MRTVLNIEDQVDIIFSENPTAVFDEKLALRNIPFNPLAANENDYISVGLDDLVLYFTQKGVGALPKHFLNIGKKGRGYCICEDINGGWLFFSTGDRGDAVVKFGQYNTFQNAFNAFLEKHIKLAKIHVRMHIELLIKRLTGKD